MYLNSHNANFSSTENSPFSSPFQSPMNSPASSRSSSPTRLKRDRSPQPPMHHVHLKRANSYRKNSRKGISKMDEMIRKRNNIVIQRTRSQSDTEVASTKDDSPRHDNDNRFISSRSDENSLELPTSTSSTLKTNDSKRREKSHSGDFTHVDHHSTHSSATVENRCDSPSSRPGTPDRKKSLSQLLDIRRFLELSPKLHRLHHRSSHNTHARTKSQHSDTTDVDSDSPDSGPLFQATTLWVPGYDFKKKQQTSLSDERPRSFLSRRGSKDKSLIALLGSSSPNLLRRGSKDKSDRNQVDHHNKNKQKFERRESSPLAAVANSKKSTIAVPKQRLRSCRSDGPDFLSVSERSAMIAKKHKDFQNLKNLNGKNEPQPQKDFIADGNVKMISHKFEDGSVFVKPSDAVTLMQGGNKKPALRRTSSSTVAGYGEHENIVRTRAESFESGEAFVTRNTRRRSYTVMTDFITMPNVIVRPPNHRVGEQRRGSESGYASPSENNDVSDTPTHGDYAGNGSRYQNNERKIRNSDITEKGISNALNVKLTNLCVTEL